jgi:hypothetical protein
VSMPYKAELFAEMAWQVGGRVGGWRRNNDGGSMVVGWCGQ